MDPKIEKQRLFEAVPIEEEVLALATHELKEARRKISLGPSVITSIVVGMCHFVFTRAKGLDTFAVKLASDGNPMLMVNPDFLLKIGATQAVFALSHEAYHLLLVHLYTDPNLMKNPNWVTAQEAVINNRVNKHLKIPLIEVDGKVAIVDPDDVYKKYKEEMKKINRTAVSREDFYETDLGCFTHLEQLPKPIEPKNSKGSCVHASDPSGEGGDGKEAAPMDPSEVGKFMDKVLSGAIQAAKAGRPNAKEEILDIMDASPEAAQTWGDLGAGVLRGETTKSTKTDLWAKWTADAMASRMADGNRWRYNRKIPFSPRVSATGKQPKKYGAVFVDASGSMHPAVLAKIANLIGDIEDIDVEWHSFDGEIWPFQVGDAFVGGGGTSFQIIEDHVQSGGIVANTNTPCCEEELDFVLVITDGYAPEIVPSEANKWIWLIVPGGTTWPGDRDMLCREIDLE